MATPHETDPAVLASDPTVVLTQELIRFDTSNHGGGDAKGETEAAEHLAARLERLGLAVERYEAEPRRTSIVTRIEGRDRSKPALVVHGHTDVVPADAANWSVDPFEGVIRDGFLWGRGAVDMKNMDAMIVTALEQILGAGEQPERDLVVAFFADEEAGGERGSFPLVRDRPELFAGATEAISEVGGYSITVGGKRAYLMQTGEKAMSWIRLHARGAAAHGSRHIRADANAVTRLAKAVAALGSHEWPVRLNGTTTRMIDELARILGVDPQRVSPDEIVLETGSAAGFLTASLRTTSNPTMLSAGYKHNVIPESATVAIDVRPFPDEVDATMARIREIVGPDIEVETLWQVVGLESPADGALVEAATASLHRFDPGAPVIPYFLSGGTDNKALSQLGISGYGFAPLRLPADVDFPAMFHGVDERVPLAALAFGREVLADFLRTY